MTTVQSSAAKAEFPIAWKFAGYACLGFQAILTARIVYEETFLTWRHGPQMVGFTMVHAFPFVLLAGMLGQVGACIWWILSIIRLARRSNRVTGTDWIPLFFVPVCVVLLATPYAFWERLVIQIAGPGTHGPEFMAEAAAEGRLALVKYLVAHGVSANSNLSDSPTPLSAAAGGGHTDIALYLISVGADVSHRNMLGDTPLHDAAEMGHLDTVKALVAHGADACALNSEGRSAAGLAHKYFHDDVKRYLDDGFHCVENSVDSCADPSVSACVRP